MGIVSPEGTAKTDKTEDTSKKMAHKTIAISLLKNFFVFNMIFSILSLCFSFEEKVISFYPFHSNIDFNSIKTLFTFGLLENQKSSIQKAK